MRRLLAPILKVWSRIQATEAWRAWTRFGAARGNLLSAGIAFYGFFSVFPAVALAAAVLGLVLRGRPDLVDSITTTASSSLPGVIKTSAHPEGLIALSAPSVSVVTISGLVGLVGLVLAGTGWVGALRDAIRAVFGMSGAPGNLVTVKLRDLGVFASLGLAVVVSAYPIRERGRALAISTTNGTAALRRSLAAEAVVVGAFLNLAAVADFAWRRQRDVLVVCAGWKGQFCLEDTVFGGALAERLAADFDIVSSDATLAARHLWEQGKANLSAYLLQSAHVRRLNSLEASQDFEFCLRIDSHADVLPVWREDRLVNNG